MIGQSLLNTNETCYSVQVAKIYNLNKAPVQISEIETNKYETRFM